MNTPNPYPESLQTLESLILTRPETLLDMHNTNERLSELFGVIGANVLAQSRFDLEMPFVDRHSAYHQLVPLVEHQANIRPETNPQVHTNVRVHSPFQPNARKFPLVGVSFTAHQWNAPLAGIQRDDLYAHFEVLPLLDARTIVTITVLRDDWVKRGRSLIKFTSR